MILFSSLVLAIFGLFNLLGINRSLFNSQLWFIIISFLGYFILRAKISQHFFKNNTKLFYWFFIGLLIITFIIGIEVKGSRRWLNLIFFNFQSSELFKVFFILFFSQYLSEKRILENHLLQFFKLLGYLLIPVFIIFKQPDLGNAIVYLFIFLILLMFSQNSKKNLIYFLFLTTFFLPIFWLILKDYQKARLLSFFNPHFDIQGTSYNMIQAVITVGSGQFFGRGLGLGTQSRLYFLPENTTDFAYSSLVEQFGFFGGFIVLIFYGLILYQIAKKIINFFYLKDKDSLINFYYCLGIFAYLAFQLIVNIGMNLGLMPIAGVALPFISYGGSSILTLMTGFALLP